MLYQLSYFPKGENGVKYIRYLRLMQVDSYKIKPV